ncbi:MAG: hypothetical protein MUF20_03210 [Methylotetracoccus sp.]|jgi:hypothetical protein|nr:hypothetical protein [Methylotetracoccus sp.]
MTTPTEQTGNDQMCLKEMNKQLQGLQARVTQAENDIVAHYQGISALVAALADTPAAAAAAAVSAFYNFEALGFKVLQALVNAIPILDFKELQLELANGLIGFMQAQLVALTDRVLATLLGAVNTLLSVALALEQEVLALEQQLASAAADAKPAIEAQLTIARNNLIASQADLQRALDDLETAKSFMASQKDLAGCQTTSSRHHT